ncbi:MAG TPA: baseplate J/gp47 family protein, partial [Thermoanaerobaculia bacterium]|nr:baseplate J/gp47 family protein [Thermoanaerobaculia bacterium]
MSEPCSCHSGCDCGGCAGTEPLTPQTIANRPGLDALAWRVGTHSSFRETMQARLSSADFPALAGLTTREASDPAIALLDAWAVVADVLTFYQERIANEGYLRTATERRSVLELARLVGYELRPGVASSVYLAYTIEEKPRPIVAPGSPVTPVATSLDEPETVVPAGSRAQSVPGPGELPQPFETSEDLQARAAWNRLQVRLTRPQQPGKLLQAESWPVALYLQGIATQLKANDPLLIATGSGATPSLYRVLAVKTDPVQDRTRADVEPWWKSAFHPAGPGPATTPPQAPATAEALAAFLAQATDLEMYGVAPGATAVRVVASLDRLQDALAAGAEEAALPSQIDETLTQLRAELQLLVAGKLRAKRLLYWLKHLVTDLQAIKTLSTTTEAASPVPPQLADLLGTLGRPPRPQPANSLHLARDVETLFASGSDLPAKLLAVARPELAAGLYAAWANVPVTPAPSLKVCALRLRASVFGHNAPLPPQGDFPDWHVNPAGDLRDVDLDSSYPQLTPGGWIALQRPDKLLIAGISQVTEQSRAAYGIAGKTTRVLLDRAWRDEADDFAVVRGTAVYAQCETLPLAAEPIAEPLCGQQIELAGLYEGLAPGRWLIVAGERADIGPTDGQGKVTVPVPGVPAAELVMVAGVTQGVAQRQSDNQAFDLPGERIHTLLTLATPLAYCYRRDTLTIFGNVAHATHGETKAEVLGSGDGAQALQSFTLRQPPLTYVSAPTPSGIASTLQVRVNDLLWHQAASLASLGPTDRSYLTSTEDGGATSVIFGNGVRGARPLTGVANIRAAYRAGIGRVGNVKAQQISQLATRPLGVKGVINPLAASGGGDPESRDQARRNAPLAVMALDRLVSVEDYADFARTFAGVGKASAARLSHGRVQLVHVTIAGEDDIPILESSDLFVNLGLALRRFGDPRQPIQVALRDRRLLAISAGVRILPDYEWE